MAEFRRMRHGELKLTAAEVSAIAEAEQWRRAPTPQRQAMSRAVRPPVQTTLAVGRNGVARAANAFWRNTFIALAVGYVILFLAATIMEKNSGQTTTPQAPEQQHVEIASTEDRPQFQAYEFIAQADRDRVIPIYGSTSFSSVA